MRNHQGFRIFSILLTILVAGCSSKGPVLPNTQAIEKTVESTLSEAITIRYLMEACSRLGGSSADNAERVYNQWISNNWKWAAAADAHYSQQLAGQTIVYKKEKIAPDALKLLADQERNAEIKIGFNRRSRANREKTCNKQLSPFSANGYKLTQKAGQAPSLRLLAKKYPQADSGPYRIPKLAGSLNPRSEPGRSLYNIESQMHSIGCKDAKLFTFHNAWPDEAYGAFCSDQRHLVMTCKWGKCKLENDEEENIE